MFDDPGGPNGFDAQAAPRYSVPPLLAQHDRIPGLSEEQNARISPDERKRLLALEPPQAWERQSDELPAAYEAFLLYRNLGPARTIIAAAREFYHDPDHSPASLTKWFHSNNWAARATAWDVHLERQKAEAEAAGIQAMNDAHIGLAALMVKKAMVRVQALDPSALSVRDLPNWIVAATKIERLARGQVTDRTVEPDQRQRDLAALSDEALNARLFDLLDLRTGRDATTGGGHPADSGPRATLAPVADASPGQTAGGRGRDSGDSVEAEATITEYDSTSDTDA